MTKVMALEGAPYNITSNAMSWICKNTFGGKPN
jgi:hypothetical protein